MRNIAYSAPVHGGALVGMLWAYCNMYRSPPTHTLGLEAFPLRHAKPIDGVNATGHPSAPGRHCGLFRTGSEFDLAAAGWDRCPHGGRAGIGRLRSSWQGYAHYLG